MLRTPLYDFHLKHGGKMVDFAGWEMPLFYARKGPDGQAVGSTIDEHHQVRRSGGLFDVSHMGRVRISGRHAARLLERVCTRRIRDMAHGQCRYSLVLNEQGGVRDDVIVYRMDDDDFTVVVNASNRAKLLDHFKSHAAVGGPAGEALVVKIDDQTTSTTMIAAQGPKVIDFISAFSREIPSLKRYTFAVKNLLVVKLVVSRTGYTGEDGVEVILPAMMTGMAMKMILKDIDVSKDDALIKPAGLGARDTLRTEAGMPLYGHELGEEINALSCGVDFAIAIDKDQDERGEPYIGMAALKRTRDAGGPARVLTGFKIEGRRSARPGMKVLVGGKEAGIVTSGCPSPTLGYPIAMALVDRGAAPEGAPVEIDTGKERLGATSVKMPFYKAPKPAAAAGAPAKK